MYVHDIEMFELTKKKNHIKSCNLATTLLTINKQQIRSLLKQKS